MAFGQLINLIRVRVIYERIVGLFKKKPAILTI